MAEIRPTLYSSELQKQLFPDNSFYKKSIGETGVADKTELVEKPVQTNISKAKEGKPSSLPLTIETSTDSKKSYPTTLLYCQPLLIDSQSELMPLIRKGAAMISRLMGSYKLDLPLSLT